MVGAVKISVDYECAIGEKFYSSRLIMLKLQMREGSILID